MLVSENMGNQTSKPDDQQPLLDDTDEEPLIEKISVVLIGRHGVGKNTVGNAILKKKAFTFQDSYKSHYLKDDNTTFDRHVTVIRVPGWSADLNSKRNRNHWQVIKDGVRSIENGPHAIILVVNKNTESTDSTTDKVKQLLGDNVFPHILKISVDAKNIVVYHSARMQTIISRCKYHFFVRCSCGKQNRKLIETIENFIVSKHDIRLYTLRKKAPNPELQHQDLANLVKALKCKISALSKSLDSNTHVIESKNAEIRELERLLKEKEDMLRTKEEEIAGLKLNLNRTKISALDKMPEELQQTPKREGALQIKIDEMERKLGEKDKEMERKLGEKDKEMERKLGEKDKEMERKLGEKDKEMERKLRKKDKEMERKLGKKDKEIKNLRKENQTLKSKSLIKNNKGEKPSSMIGTRQKDTNSIELIPITSAGMLLDSEEHQADETLQVNETHRDVQFLKKNRKELIKRIVAVRPIADELHALIGHHKYEKIVQPLTEYEQNRQLFDIMEKSGTKLQIELYKCLLKHEKYLVEDLEESP